MRYFLFPGRFFFFIYKQTWDIWIEWMLYVYTGALSERKLVFDFILIFMSRMSALFWLKWKRAKRSGIKSSSQNFNDFIFFTDWKEAVPACSLLPESKSHPLSNFFIWCHTCYKHQMPLFMQLNCVLRVEATVWPTRKVLPG